MKGPRPITVQPWVRGIQLAFLEAFFFTFEYLLISTIVREALRNGVENIVSIGEYFPFRLLSLKAEDLKHAK